MNKQYYATKCVLNDDNLVIFFPTEIFDSINELMEYSQDFFNNRKIYQTSEEGTNESYIKCVGEESKMIHLVEK
tara:strand:+ start:862 stop:1083 length:222 start_codon:yes stop_codon:yes gene_type:complete